MENEKVDIVIIDDDSIVCRMLKEEFADTNYNVVAISDAVEGLQLVIDKKPKLAILDLDMPQLTGADLMVKFSEALIFKDTRFFLFTGQKMDEMDRIKMMTLGFERIFYKTDGPKPLVERVAKEI